MPELLAAGYRVRCMAREADRLAGFPWIGQVEVAEADALDRFPYGGHWPGWTWRTT